LNPPFDIFAGLACDPEQLPSWSWRLP